MATAVGGSGRRPVGTGRDEVSAFAAQEPAEGQRWIRCVAPLDLPGAVDADADTFEAALEELAETLMHHLDEGSGMW